MKRHIPNAWRIIVLVVAVFAFAGTGVYCVRSADRISGLYTELRQQRRLREIQDRHISAMADNRKLVEEYKKPKTVALEDMTAAIVNLSTLMKVSGLTETYFKLEQRETVRETDGVTGICRLVIEGTGTYELALEYLNSLADGEFYYFMDNIKITAEDDGGVRLRAVCVVTGFGGSPGDVMPEPPREYLFRDPFGGADDER